MTSYKTFVYVGASQTGQSSTDLTNQIINTVKQDMESVEKSGIKFKDSTLGSSSEPSTLYTSILQFVEFYRAMGVFLLQSSKGLCQCAWNR